LGGTLYRANVAKLFAPSDKRQEVTVTLEKTRT